MLTSGFTVLQLHLMFGDDIVGASSQNELYGKVYVMKLFD
jgi:hypothetical protein